MSILILAALASPVILEARSDDRNHYVLSKQSKIVISLARCIDCRVVALLAMTSAHFMLSHVLLRPRRAKRDCLQANFRADKQAAVRLPSLLRES